jgi:hypothetical protein
MGPNLWDNALHRVFDPLSGIEIFTIKGGRRIRATGCPLYSSPERVSVFSRGWRRTSHPQETPSENTSLAGHSRTRRFHGHRHCGRRTSEKSSTELCRGRHNSGLRTPHCHNNPNQISPVELPELHQRIELGLRERSQEEFPTERS